MEYLMAVGGLVLLILSGKYLVFGGVRLSSFFNLSPLVIGMTVIAFGTSAPELIVSVQAVFNELPDIAVGNIIGSNIANIALVLALTAIILPIQVRSKKIMRDWLVMMFASILLFVFILNDAIDNWEGIILFAILIVYIVISLREKNETPQIETGEKRIHIGIIILIILASSGGLALGSDLLVKGASQIAKSLGVSDKIISISLIAFGTSIPELATSVIAALKKETDISIGNIIGSNIFNILAVLGIASMLKKIAIPSFKNIYFFDLSVMIFISLLLLLLLWPLKNGLLSRWKGFVLFAIYCGYIYMLINGFSFSPFAV